jgi:hypothetical protein
MSALVLGSLLGLMVSGWAYLSSATKCRMRRYWQRACMGRVWQEASPTARSDDIRRFLLLFVNSFGFSQKRALRFAPADRLLDVYCALYPLKNMPKRALEFDTFAKLLKATYGLDLARIWRQDITLGGVFAQTTAAV